MTRIPGRVYDAVFFVGIIGLVLLLAWTVPPVRAKASEPAPACTPIGATGNIVISRCEDAQTGQVLYVNNIGFMVLEQ